MIVTRGTAHWKSLLPIHIVHEKENVEALIPKKKKKKERFEQASLSSHPKWENKIERQKRKDSWFIVVIVII